jgi:hypothetical protein
MDFPTTFIAPSHLHTFSLHAGGFAVSTAATAVSASTWPVANTAFYIPIHLPFPYLLKRMFWINSSGVTSANRDVGVYTEDGAALFTAGSTALVGASVAQYVTLGTPIFLTPGRYYLGMSTDVTTANRGAQGNLISTNVAHLAGVLQQDTAFPLPSTMTPASATNGYYPLLGITSTDSGF